MTYDHLIFLKYLAYSGSILFGILAGLCAVSIAVLASAEVITTKRATVLFLIGLTCGVLSGVCYATDQAIAERRPLPAEAL